ncbi:MAG: diacylglycerol kinase family protein [Acidimicrobiales bacterium]
MLVVNPSASAVTAENRLAVENALGGAHDVTVEETRRRCHAIELAKKAVADGLDAVVVLGGDGTVNEAANGLAGSSTALGVLPGGSTNVFARTVGMGRRPAAAAGRLCAAMAGGAPHRIGLGLANGRYFVFHVGMGFDAAVIEQVEQIERRLPMKRMLGQVVFAYCTVATWLCRYDRSQTRFTIHLDASAEAAEPIAATFAICLNTNPYTFIGSRPLNVDPAATLDSPLSLAAFRNIGLATMGAVLTRSLVGGSLDDIAAVHLHSGLHALTVEGPRPFSWQLDGDLAGEGVSLALSYEPACLDVFVPGDTTGR